MAPPDSGYSSLPSSSSLLLFPPPPSSSSSLSSSLSLSLSLSLSSSSSPSSSTSHSHPHLSSKNVSLITTFKLCTVVLLWYTCSSLTNNLGKQIMNDFNYPLTLTYFQFFFIALCSYLYVQGFHPHGSRLEPLSRKVLLIVSPLIIFNVIGHSFSSVAIANSSVSFVHTVKALSPFFTVLFSKIMLGSHFNRDIYLSLIPLTTGVILACSSELSFNVIGFFSSLASAVIFVLQNIVSKKIFQEGQLDELNLLYYSSLFAFLAMTPFWLFSDGASLLSDSSPLTTNVMYLFLANGITHFGQNIFAFTLLTMVTPVSYSVGSLMKRVFIIVTSIIWFNSVVSLANSVGLVLTFVGLWCYTMAKNESKRDSALSLPSHRFDEKVRTKTELPS